MPTSFLRFPVVSRLSFQPVARSGGVALLLGLLTPLGAQTTDGTGAIVFGPGNTERVATFFTSAFPSAEAVRFEATGSVNQGVVVDTANVAVTMNSGSSILSPAATAYALRFTNTGGSLVANGATLRASTTGVLNFVNAANATLTDTVIDFTPSAASNAAAVLLQNGGTFSATGGSIAYNPSAAISNVNYALRNTAGSLALSLTDVAVSVGTTTTHRGYGLDLAGGGTVTLAGTTAVTSRQAEALRLNGDYTVTSAATLTRLGSTGAHADGAVRLTSGVTSLTNQAAGVINGAADSFSAGGALVIATEASGSSVTNAGTIDGIATENTGGYFAALALTNSGTIAVTNRAAVTLGSGSLNNQFGGTISGGVLSQGVTVSSGETGTDFSLTNAGAISGGTAVSASARSVTVTNQAGGTLTGTATAGTAYGATLTAAGGSATLNNTGTISGRQGVQITGTGDVASAQNLTVTNAGTLTGTVSQGVRIDSDFPGSAARNIVVTNENGALIQGGTTTPGFFNISNSAVYAANRGTGTIAIDNYGTIDARNQTNAIGVSVSDSVQATVTLHSGSTTTGAIRGTNPNSSLNANITVAFSGSGTFSGVTSGINNFRKADAGTWTHAGERTGGSITVTAGTLVLANRDSGSSVSVNVTNGTLRLAPGTADLSGQKTLDAESMSIGAGGRLEVTSTARAIVRGNGRVENGGVMVVDGSTTFGSGNLFPAIVATNGLLAGTGRVLGHVNIENGGIVDAGNGNLGNAGILHVFETGFIPGTLTVGDGGLLRWTLAALSETGAGVNFDQIGLGTNANLLYETGARFVLDFAAFGDGPEASNTFWHTARSWEFANGGTVTGGANLLFASTGFATYDVAGVGYFTLNSDGRTLEWTPDLAAIPEPSTWALIFGSLALGVVVWRRRSGQ